MILTLSIVWKEVGITGHISTDVSRGFFSQIGAVKEATLTWIGEQHVLVSHSVLRFSLSIVPAMNLLILTTFVGLSLLLLLLKPLESVVVAHGQRGFLTFRVVSVVNSFIGSLNKLGMIHGIIIVATRRTEYTLTRVTVITRKEPEDDLWLLLNLIVMTAIWLVPARMLILVFICLLLLVLWAVLEDWQKAISVFSRLTAWLVVVMSSTPTAAGGGGEEDKLLVVIANDTIRRFLLHFNVTAPILWDG